MLKGVAFDLGGVLLKWEGSREKAFKAEFEKMNELGYEISHQKFKEISKKTSEEFDKKYHQKKKGHSYGEFMRMFFENWGEDASEEDLKKIDKAFWKTLINNQEPMPFSTQIIDYCKRERLKLGIITNANEEITNGRLKRLGWRDKFHTIVNSESIGAQKSSLKPFRAFLDKIGIEGEECLMVGDRQDEDVYAKELEMKTVLLQKEGFPEKKPDCDYIIEDLKELKHIIDNYQTPSN